MCRYAVGVYDPAASTLKVVPLGGGQVFRMQPRVREVCPKNRWLANSASRWLHPMCSAVRIVCGGCVRRMMRLPIGRWRSQLAIRVRAPATTVLARSHPFERQGVRASAALTAALPVSGNAG